MTIFVAYNELQNLILNYLKYLLQLCLNNRKSANVITFLNFKMTLNYLLLLINCLHAVNNVKFQVNNLNITFYIYLIYT